jgi:two-component system, NtrC family, sensor histidine kinase PilS
MQLESLPNLNDWMSLSHRRNLRLFSLYRLTIAIVLLLSQPFFNNAETAQLQSSLPLKILLVYFVFSIGAFVLSWTKRPSIEINLPVQIIIDIGFIILMMHLSNQDQSGFGLILIITIVFASLISEGKYALFYASIASIGILSEQTYNVLFTLQTVANYSNAALLSMACFATAWLAYTLASRMQKSDRLASERGIDINNLVKINALITQEMHNGVLVVSQTQLLQHYNPQFVDLTAISSLTLTEAIVNKTPLSAIAPELAQLLDAWLKLDQEAKKTEVTKLACANKDLGIRFSSTSIHSQGSIVIFVEDWSQLQTQAHQVKLVALGRLTANIAHEIRNPLSAISHASQLLQEDNSDPSSLRMLKIIADNVQRLDQIIKDILELNRRDRTSQESIQLNAFLSEFHQQFCVVQKIDQANFTLNLSREDSLISFDKRHLNQILWNLCINGWRHSKKQQASLKLSIKPHQNKSLVNIQISDDGPGIAYDIQSTVFEPFVTTENTGTGLGLYITKELTDANGAKIDFTSSNKGTQFTLSIAKG